MLEQDFRRVAFDVAPLYRDLRVRGATFSGRPAEWAAEVLAYSRAVRETLAKEDVRQKFTSTGSAIMERGPDDFVAFVGSEINRWGPVIRSSGVKLD